MLPCTLSFPQNEELCKAATFVLQSCMHQDPFSSQTPQPIPFQQQEDHRPIAQGHQEDHLSVSITRLDNLLQQQKPTAPSSPSSQSGASCSEARELLETSGIPLQELLQMLDQQKLPVSDRVSKWLDATNTVELTGMSQAPTALPQELRQLQPFLQSQVGETAEATSDEMERIRGMSNFSRGKGRAFEGLPKNAHVSEELPTILGPGESGCIGGGDPLQIVHSNVHVALLPADPTQLQLQNLKAAYLAARANASPAVGLARNCTKQPVKSKRIQMPGPGLGEERSSKQLHPKKTGFQQQASKTASEQKQSIEVTSVHEDICPAEAPAVIRKAHKSALGTKASINVSQPAVALWCKPSKQAKTVQSKDSVNPAKSFQQRREDTAISELERERAQRKKLEMELHAEKTRFVQLEQAYHQLNLAQGSTSDERIKGGEEQRASEEGIDEAGHCSAIPSPKQGLERAQNLPRPHALFPTDHPMEGGRKKGTDTEKANRSQEKRSTSTQLNKEELCGKRSTTAEQETRPTASLRSRQNIRYASDNSFHEEKSPNQCIVGIPGKEVCKSPSHLPMRQTTHTGELAPHHPFPTQHCEPSYTDRVGNIGKQTEHLVPRVDRHSPTPCSHSLAPTGTRINHSDMQCLGCRPRMKCPLITSRNFVRLLKADRYTCLQHRRLVNHLQQRSTLNSTALIRPTVRYWRTAKEAIRTPQKVIRQGGTVPCSQQELRGNSCGRHPMNLDTGMSGANVLESGTCLLKHGAAISDPDSHTQEQEWDDSSDDTLDAVQQRDPGQEVGEQRDSSTLSEGSIESCAAVEIHNLIPGNGKEYSADPMSCAATKNCITQTQRGEYVSSFSTNLNYGSYTSVRPMQLNAPTYLSMFLPQTNCTTSHAKSNKQGQHHSSQLLLPNQQHLTSGTQVPSIKHNADGRTSACTQRHDNKGLSTSKTWRCDGKQKKTTTAAGKVGHTHPESIRRGKAISTDTVGRQSKPKAGSQEHYRDGQMHHKSTKCRRLQNGAKQQQSSRNPLSVYDYYTPEKAPTKCQHAPLSTVDKVSSCCSV